MTFPFFPSLSLLSLLLLVFPQWVRADPSSSAFRLNNGVRIILEVDRTRSSVSYTTAWRLDRLAPPKAGIGHLLQHVLDAAESSRALHNFMNMNKRGTISHESMPDANFQQMEIPKADLLNLLQMDHDRLKEIRVEEKGLRTEKLRLVQEQQATRNASLGIEEGAAMAAFAYLDPWYYQPSEGLEKSVNSITPQELEQFFLAHYKAENLTIAVVGDFDMAVVRKKLEEVWGNFPAYGRQRLPLSAAPSYQSTLPRMEWPIFKKNRLSLTLAFPIPSWSDRDTSALEVLSDYLTKGDNSLVNRRLFRDQRIGMAARSDVPVGMRPQLFQIYFLLAEGVKEGEAIKAMRALLQEIQDNGIPSDEFERLKATRQLEFRNQVKAHPSFTLVLHDLFHNSYASLFGRLESYAKLSSLDVQQITARYLMSVEPFMVVGTEKKDQR